jgi:hypothetical protein
MDTAKANAIIAATMAKVTGLEAEMEQLQGKENKKARNTKSREIADLKKESDFIDAERVLAGKEALSPSNKGKGTPKADDDLDKAALFSQAAVMLDGKPAYIAPTNSIVSKDDKKEKKKKEEKGLSDAEKMELEKLKEDIVAKKAELKGQGKTGGQINKDEEVVKMVTRMQALKEKEGTLEKKDAKKEVKQAKGNPEEIAKVKKEIEEYLGKLKDEFKYSKQDIAKDPDMLDLQKKLKDLGGK